MQDFNYLSSNDFEITLELGCDKFPSEDKLPEEWMNNREALINFIWQAHKGIKGVISNAVTNQLISGATIHVVNITDGVGAYINHDITSVHDGDYWRLLTPGKYEVKASHPNYVSLSKVITVTNKEKQPAHTLHFELMPLQEFKNNELDSFENNHYRSMDSLNEESEDYQVLPNIYRKKWHFYMPNQDPGLRNK